MNIFSGTSPTLGEGSTSRNQMARLRLMVYAMLCMLGVSTLFVSQANATHYMGGEIIYTHVTGNIYTLRATLYRDCSGVTMGTSTPVSITAPGFPTINASLPRLSFSDITPLCPGQVSRCASTAGPYGVEEHIYQTNVTLNPGPATYTIAATGLCCRNNAINTITSPGSQQMYVATTIDPNISPRNSSPRFLNKPIAFLCANQPAVISPNAFDPDGDAIVYSLTACRDLNANDPLTYAPGFTPTTPLSSSTGINLNPNTGALSFTPTVVNQVSVVCVRAEEFRNGVKIGEIVRDIQIRVLNCNNQPPVIAPVANVVVPVGTTYCVNINATDADNHNITLTAVSGIIPPATFTTTGSGAGFANGVFCFTPSSVHEGNTFTVTVNATDNGCPAIATGVMSFNITVPAVCRVSASASSTPATCGLSNGSASASLTGGTAPYQYTWSGPGGYANFGQQITNVPAGTYSVTIVDGNSCVASETVVVGTSGSNIVATATAQGAVCGQNNGSLTISVTGGTGPFSYSLNGGPSQTSNVFTGLGQGNYTFVVTDNFGCSNGGSAQVGSTPDIIAPSISCPANISVNNDAGICGANVSFNSASATDNCSTPSVVQTSGPASGGQFGIGTTTVSFTAVDASGNTASCSFTVTVIDAENPVISCPSSMTLNNDAGQCGSVVSFSASATDNCPGVTTTQTGGPSSGSLFPIGTTSVSFSANDAVGNSASCSFDVTVVDAENPVISCPSSMSLNNDAGQCGAVVSFSASATDNCPGVTTTQTGGLSSGSLFPIGTSSVSFSASDAAGNSANCSFDVTVADAENPVISCPSSMNLNTDAGVCGAVVNFNATATDNCPGVTVGQTSGLSSGSLFPLGTSSVSFVATDASGNSASCSFDVTVSDNEAPNAICQNVTVQLNAAGNGSTTASAVDNGSNDACGIQSISLDNTTFTCANVGNNAATLTVTDVNGNVSTCTANITVQDNVAPTAVCQDVTVQLNVSGNGSTTANAVNNGSSDACGIQSISLSNTNFNCSNVGNNTVVLTVTDVNGNVSTCSANVTVLSSPVTVALSSPTYGCGYNVSCFGSTNGSALSSVVGGCAPYTYAWSNGSNSANAGGLGAGTYTVTVTDVTGVTAVATITLTEPTAVTASASGNDVSCFGGNDGDASATAGGGCAPYTYSWSNGASGSSNGNLTAGTYTVTVTDANGCSATASVTVSEPTELVANAGSNVTVAFGYTNQYGCTTLNGTQTGGTPGYSGSWSANGMPVGTGSSVQVCPSVTTVYCYTVVDANGCTSTSCMTVCVVDVRCAGTSNNGNNGGNTGGQGGQGWINGNAAQHVAVCHTPPGQPGTSWIMCLPPNAVPSHLNHGDQLGACGALTAGCNSRLGEVAGEGSEVKTSNLNMQAFPNPTTGSLKIELNSESFLHGSVEIRVMDAVGKVIETKFVTMAYGQAFTELNIGSQPAGFYFIMANDGTSSAVEKVMKQ